MSRRMVCRIVVLALVGGPLSAVSLPAQTTGIREVSASARSLIPLQTRLRYTTMIVLPEGEEILDVICGDRDFWVISSTHNIAHVKPAKEGAATNLNLVTASGAVYSFLLSEKNGASMPDMKVYVNEDPNAPQRTAEVLQCRADGGPAGRVDGGSGRRGGGEPTRGRIHRDLSAAVPGEAAVRLRHPAVLEAIPRTVDVA